MTSGNAEPPNHDPLGPFIAYFEKACKPRERWRVGIEHERFAYRLHDRRPASYRGEDGIEGFLNRLARQGWRPIYEGPHIVKVTRGAAAVSLEPGGQVEFASAPAASLHVLDADVQRHAREIARAAEDVGLGFFALGLQPHWPPEEIPWVPKQRFAIMRGYMPRVGRCGLDMMQSTCSIQASFDYADERDVVRKTRLALAAQPLVAALFANSPFAAGRPSGFSSVRNHVWANTDADRCGIPEFFFEPSMSFERYVRWVMRVPLYSVVRGGHHVDMTRYTFADLLAGRPADVSPATVDDFELQLNAVSTEARLKSVLEMRGADSGSTEMVTALAGLWCGLLYDDDALESAWEHFGSWSAHDRASLYARTPALSMGDLVGETSVRARLEALLDSSAAGLARRAVRHPANGADERVYLEPLFELLESSSRQCERLLRAYNGAWRQSTEPVLERCGP